MMTAYLNQWSMDLTGKSSLVQFHSSTNKRSFSIRLQVALMKLYIKYKGNEREKLKMHLCEKHHQFHLRCTSTQTGADENCCFCGSIIKENSALPQNKACI